MVWFCSGASNTELVQNLWSWGVVKNERVKQAMLSVDRAHYAPSSPYSDYPQSIGHSATISAPHMHAYACDYLADFLHPGARVLDIGCGSGYLTHVFAKMVTNSTPGQEDSDGHVIGLEHIQGLVDLSRHNIQKSKDGKQLLESGKIELVKGDGRLGWKDGGPYDAIHVGAAAATLYPVLIEQLRAPGRMFIPVESGSPSEHIRHMGLRGEQYIWLIDKRADGKIDKERVLAVNYVPLTDPPS